MSKLRITVLPTKEDEKDFTRIVQENITMHPFTAIRYVSMGWLVRANKDFSFYSNCYNVTEEGLKVVRNCSRDNP